MSSSRATPHGTASAEPAAMPLMEHLKELRTRLIKAFAALLIAMAASLAIPLPWGVDLAVPWTQWDWVTVTRKVLAILVAPMGDTMPQALKPTESIGNYMKVALICGVTLAMPIIVYQIARFVAPGLTRKERRYLILLVPGATLCFVTGVAFAYFVMLPAAIPFLQGFLDDIIAQQWAIGEYLSFVTSLLFWIGVAFELPLFVYFLAKLGVVNAEMLIKNFKYAVVAIAALAAIITPTVDPLNMILVMGPLIILYVLGILLAKLA
jgi:sec-independent protein translocase protein TatC